MPDTADACADHVEPSSAAGRHDRAARPRIDHVLLGFMNSLDDHVEVLVAVALVPSVICSFPKEFVSLLIHLHSYAWSMKPMAANKHCIRHRPISTGWATVPSESTVRAVLAFRGLGFEFSVGRRLGFSWSRRVGVAFDRLMDEPDSIGMPIISGLDVQQSDRERLSGDALS